MSDRVRSWLLVAWAASVVGVLGLNVGWPLSGAEEDWPWVSGLMAFPVAGAIVLARRPGNVIGRILALVGVAAGAIFTLTWYAVTYPEGPLSASAEALSSPPATAPFAAVVALLFLFPSGRPVNRRHARVLAVFLCYVAVFAVLLLVQPGPMFTTGRPNPFAVGGPWVRVVADTGGAGVPVFALVGLWSLAVRRRHAGALERAQLRWFFAGAGAVLTLLVTVFLFPEDFSPAVEAVATVFVVLAFWSLPAAIVVAIIRYRLFEIDRIISRTVTYSVVAVVLLAVYAGSVVGLQAILPLGGSDLAVAGSTLAVAALFGPLRQRVRSALDRRFDRERYEAQQVSRRYADGLRQGLDLEAITADLCDAVGASLQPASVAVWLAPPTIR